MDYSLSSVFEKIVLLRGDERITFLENFSDLKVRALCHNKEMHALNGNIYVWDVGNLVRNRLMHALNGNVDFPVRMDDVVSLMDMDKASRKPVNGEMDLVSYASAMAKIPTGYVGANFNWVNASYLSAFRITPLNALTPLAEQFFPTEIVGVARQFYDGEGSVALSPSVVPLSYVGTMFQNSDGIPLLPTPLVTEVARMMDSTGIIPLNRNNTTKSGFTPTDIVSIVNDTTINSWVGESAYMKLLAQLHLTASSNANTGANIYNFNQLELNDCFSQTNNTVPVTAGINNSPVFDEDCGGNNCVFPFVANATAWNDQPGKGYFGFPCINKYNTC